MVEDKDQEVFPDKKPESGDEIDITLEDGTVMAVEYCNDPTNETGELIYNGKAHYRLVDTDNGLRLMSNEPDEKQTDYCGVKEVVEVEGE